MSTDELVLVVPRAALMGDPGWLGVTSEGLDTFEAIVARDGEFRPRGEMEVDRSWKQVIPYLVLRDGPTAADVADGRAAFLGAALGAAAGLLAIAASFILFTTPEPASIATLVAGLAGIALVRRRRSSARPARA